MSQERKYDVCVVGSGAGAGPLILQLSRAGHKVVVLEKGPWIKTGDFTKDEIVASRKDSYSPKLSDEFHVLEYKNKEGDWIETTTKESGSYWNGNCVGGSSNFMSGYFHRKKPNDFKLLSTYGKIDGANIVDWPISYNDLEPFYALTETEVGISGKVIPHQFLEPRSTSDFPFPQLGENIAASWLDEAAQKNNSELIPMPRAIISTPKNDRKACYYSGYCGGYGCSSDAKGSSRASLLKEAIKTGNCEIIDNAKVFHLETNGKNDVIRAHFYKNDKKESVRAHTFIVACNAVETSRLLLMSKNDDAPNGIGNENNLVGKNLISTGGGIGEASFRFDDLKESEVDLLRIQGNFINRASQQWYEINDENSSGKLKGGTVDFLFEHSNPTSRLMGLKKQDGKLVFGSELKTKIKDYFTKQRTLKFEIFNDWLPTDECYVSLSEEHTDKWGDPVAKIRINTHPHDAKISEILGKKTKELLSHLPVENIQYKVSYGPSSNLIAGGCRFGNDPKTSVLDAQCKVHSTSNLYITDGSFMPTGGSVTYTWTIYANAFRVAQHLVEKLKK